MAIAKFLFSPSYPHHSSFPYQTLSQFNEFVERKISHQNARSLSHFYDQVADSDWCAAELLLDIMNIREGSSVLKISDSGTFSASELTCVMMRVATNSRN